MKKLITVVLILSIIFSLIGCHKKSGKNKNGSGYSESGDNTAKYNNSSGQDINAGVYKSGDGYTLNNTFDLIKERKSSEFNVDNNALISRKEDNFTNCWKYNVETGMLTFSNYIVGFDLNTRLDTRLIARGFVEYEGEDGATHILYSVAINRSVNGIKSANGNTIENFENKIG